MTVLDVKNKSDHTKAKMFLDSNGGPGIQRYDVVKYKQFEKLTEKQLVNFKSITEDFFKYLDKDIKICKSEKEAKVIALDLSDNSSYPVYFFKTDTSGEKPFEEFFEKTDTIDNASFSEISVIKNKPFANKA